MTNPPDQTTTSLSEIVVQKDQLLTTLRDNRKVHAEIYEAAKAGFWVQTKETLDKRKSEFSTAITEASESFGKQYSTLAEAVDKKERDSLAPFNELDAARSSYGGKWILNFLNGWVPSFPTHHLEDYDRAIKMLEFSVADKVTLAVADFDAYVQNNWKWKEQFEASNRGFVQCVTGGMFSAGTLSMALSGYAAGGKY